MKIRKIWIPLLAFLLLGCSQTAPTNKEGEDETPEKEETQTLPNPMNEPYIARQYYLNHIGDIYAVWKQYRGKGITIAVIDAGFNPYHEDIVDRVSDKSASFTTSGNDTSTDIGIDKVVDMGDSHGTFCAGVAAASLNGKGVIGIAPEATLLLLKTDKKPKSIVKAFHYAADNGAKVVTISIGSYYLYVGDLVNDGSDLGTVFDESINYCRNKGVVVCSAAGNGGLDNQPTEFTFPGCVDGVIGAGGLAANSSQEIWTGSSYNSSSEYQFADVFAPADNMFGCCHYDNKLYDGGWNGTSFASPIVAGLAALYFEKNPTKTVANFENDLFNSCHKLTNSEIANVDQLGYGRVDASKLLGISSSEKVNVTLSAFWSDAYAYIWNSNSGASLKAWPGTKMEKNNDNFVIEIDTSKYDSLIFTKSSSGPQTVDLNVNSFAWRNLYSLNISTSESGKLIGQFQ